MFLFCVFYAEDFGAHSMHSIKIRNEMNISLSFPGLLKISLFLFTAGSRAMAMTMTTLEYESYE